MPPRTTTTATRSGVRSHPRAMRLRVRRCVWCCSRRTIRSVQSAISEEHEIPRHFRRVHGDLTRLGGPLRAREELATSILDDGNSLPEYDLGPVGNAFRREVRQWLAENWLGEAKAREDALPFH